MEYIKKSSLTDHSIEDWCKKYDEAPKSKLTDNQAKYLINVLLKSKELDNDEQFNSELRKDFICSVISKRLRLYDFNLTPSAIFIISTWSESSGDVVMLLTYLQYKCKLLDKWELSPSDLCDIFPDGIPSSEDKMKLWDSQKVERLDSMDSDNLLDHIWCMGSIRK